MRTSFSKSIAILISAGIAAAGFVSGASAQQQQAPQGWFKVCSKQEDLRFLC